jgi:mycothione reductase
MKEYDIIVIGSGCGMIIANEAMAHGVKVAVLDKGPRIGGTCLNYGCIPSKMLIHTADRIMEIKKGKELGIETEIQSIDFNAIMQRMRRSRDDGEQGVRKGIKLLEGLDFYEGEGRFVADYTLDVNGERIKGDMIFIASGARPLIPPVKGLESVDYLTNESALELKDRPESMIIIGGGYIGVEYAHFFAAMGTKVTIVEMADRLVLSEEPEIASLLLKELEKRLTVALNTRVAEIKARADSVTVIAEDTDSGKQKEYHAQRIMMAVGRSSNADLLEVKNTGVEVDRKGFIKVTDFFETSKKKIFAVGDANGKQMFTHAANREAALAIHNVLHDAKAKVNPGAVPHAVYSYPPIASVGLREKTAREKHQVLVGMTRYYEVAKGEAMMEKESFAKAIADAKTGRILGFHIIGPHAPELIQEVVNAMASGGHINEINEGIHIHPALSELVPVTINSLEDIVG